MDVIDELGQLSEPIRQVAALPARDDIDKASNTRSSTFLNAVVLGNVGAGKSAILNNLIGHSVLPMGENGCTRAPISIELHQDGSLSSNSIILHSDNKSQQVSASVLRNYLQDRLCDGSSDKSKGEIYLKLSTSTAFFAGTPLKLIDLPGLDQQIMDGSLVRDYTKRNDVILLIVVPAHEAPQISFLGALEVARKYDRDGIRTIGVISKIDQAATNQKSLHAVRSLLSNKGPSAVWNIPWVAQCDPVYGNEGFQSISCGVPHNKLGRAALVDALAVRIGISLMPENLLKENLELKSSFESLKSVYEEISIERNSTTSSLAQLKTTYMQLESMMDRLIDADLGKYDVGPVWKVASGLAGLRFLHPIPKLDKPNFIQRHLFSIVICAGIFDLFLAFIHQHNYWGITNHRVRRAVDLFVSWAIIDSCSPGFLYSLTWETFVGYTCLFLYAFYVLHDVFVKRKK